MVAKMKIYGFGSYFSSDKSYRDIDMLIIHESNSRESCMQAIKLKKNLLKKIEGAHVSILSKSAEAHFDFLFSSHAVSLEIVNENDFLSHLNKTISKVAAFRKT